MSGLGFLSPLMLGFAALSIPIFLLYMLRLRRTDMQISSTFLWQQLIRDREANAPWQRLRPNLLMLLQLLILLALVLALARPFREVKTITTGRIVLLLDASASMNATDMEDGKSRFEMAQELAHDTVDTLGADDTMTVIRVAEVPEVLAAATHDKSVLRRAIGEAEPSESSADWAAAITLAAAGARGVDTLHVVILSDGGLSGNLPSVPGDIKYVRVGEDSNNVALSALSTRVLPGEDPQLFAQLRNFGDQDTEIIFEIQLDGQLYNSQFYTVLADSTLDIVVEHLPNDFRELEAIVSRRSGSTVPDYLENDNVAYAVNGEISTGEVLVMTTGNTFLEEIFNSILGINLTLGDPTSGLPGGEYELIVLDQWLPDDELPDTDLFIIAPPESTAAFTLTGESTNTRVDELTGGVLRDDDRVRFVDFSTVDVRAFSTLDNIEWATVLVETEAGEPLVLAGEFEGRQIAVMTFALQDSNLPLQLAWPIMVTSLVDWYRPQRAISVDSLTPGQAVVVRPTVEADAVRIQPPDGDSAIYPLEESPQVAYAETRLPGFYQVGVLLDGDVVQSDSFAVNLFDARESNIAPADEVRVQTNEGETAISSTAREETGRRELWRYLAIIGLLILSLEWWYYHRNLHAKPKAVELFPSHEAPPPKPWWQFWVRQN